MNIVSMKTSSENTELDEMIGTQGELRLSKEEQDLIRVHRSKMLENRTESDKILDILTGFRFSLMNYINTSNPSEIISLGDFLNKLLKEINVKKGFFADYIEISPRNINKYFSGERKFTIDHALKFEKLFHVPAETFLELQVKNELIEAKRSHRGDYEKYNLNDLMAV
jgi:antitoxin HigA-1